MARIARASVGSSDSGIDALTGKPTGGDDAVVGAVVGDFAGGSGDGGGDGGNDGGDAGTGKRPRKPRVANGTRTAKKGAASVKGLQSTLEGFSAILAVSIKTPELVLEEDESKPLAESIAEVLNHFDIPALDPKYVAVVGLCFTLGKVYVPKAILISQRLEEEKRAKKAKNVTSFPVTKFDPPT